MSNKKLQSLIALLRDEDKNISSVAMSKILEYKNDSKEMNIIMAELQESPEPTIRRKIHQIQAIQRVRRRRGNLSKKFVERTSNLLQGLSDLNIIWYDEYTNPNISKLWNKLIFDAIKHAPRTPSRVADYLKTQNFTTSSSSVRDSDSYCILAVLEDRIGTDVILAAVALELARVFGMFGSIVYSENYGFGVIYSNHQSNSRKKEQYFGEILFPSANWKLFKPEDVLPFKVWSNSKVLKYITSMLLVSAIASDEPRYIQILGTCLTNRKITDSLCDILPYPLGNKDIK
jgi:hypothetical protein